MICRPFFASTPFALKDLGVNCKKKKELVFQVTYVRNYFLIY